MQWCLLSCFNSIFQWLPTFAACGLLDSFGRFWHVTQILNNLPAGWFRTAHISLLDTRQETNIAVKSRELWKYVHPRNPKMAIILKESESQIHTIIFGIHVSFRGCIQMVNFHCWQRSFTGLWLRPQWPELMTTMRCGRFHVPLGGFRSLLVN